MSFAFSSLFGPTLVTKSDPSVNTDSHLSGKYVGVYFSAHWCGPCRSFTPILAEFYTMMQSKGASFEIVFVSSDRDQSGFDEYYGSMPWASLPFSDRDRKGKLSNKFKVQGIPTFAILGPEGNVITTKGREKLSSDPTGEQFPWFPTTFTEDLGTSFDSKKGTVNASSFAGKYLGLYFSAHWCPPCRNFTPKLVKFYNDRKASGKDDFEVVFVSSDREPEAFNEYYGSMPWLAIPFSDQTRGSALSDRFEVSGIPTLVILDADRNVITTSAVSSISNDVTGAKFPFFPEPVEDLSQTTESFGQDINNCPSLIAFIEPMDDSAQTDAVEAIKPHAEQWAKGMINSGQEPRVIFFVNTQSNRIADQIRTLTKTNDSKHNGRCYLALLDLPDNGGYYLSDNFEPEDFTTEKVGEFLNGFFSKTLKRLQISR